MRINKMNKHKNKVNFLAVGMVSALALIAACLMFLKSADVISAEEYTEIYT